LDLSFVALAAMRTRRASSGGQYEMSERRRRRRRLFSLRSPFCPRCPHSQKGERARTSPGKREEKRRLAERSGAELSLFPSHSGPPFSLLPPDALPSQPTCPTAERGQVLKTQRSALRRIFPRLTRKEGMLNVCFLFPPTSFFHCLHFETSLQYPAKVGDKITSSCQAASDWPLPQWSSQCHSG